MNHAELEATQREKLGTLLGEVGRRNPFYRRKLVESGHDPDAVAQLVRDSTSTLLEVLAHLPLTTKSELQEDQAAEPPYGTNLTWPLERYSRLHRTSGSTGRPLRWLDTPESWTWWLRCWEEVWRAAGVGAHDRYFFAFSFGPFIGFWSAFESAQLLGGLVVSGGGMSTSQRLECLLAEGVTVVACTPTYALHLAEVAAREGHDLASSTVRTVVVAGEPGGSIPATRRRIEEAWGARCFDHCGMTEVGPFGFEHRDAPGGLHVFEPEFIVEVLDPSSQRRVPDGQTGELVITGLGRTGSPALRYRTGDLVRWTPGDPAAPCPFGRLEGGVLARIDDMVIVRGNNVYPSALEGILREFQEVAEYRLRVARRGEMSDLLVEIEPRGGSQGKGIDPAELCGRVDREIQRRMLFRARVRSVAPGTLPRFELKSRRWVRDTDPESGTETGVAGGSGG